MKYTFYCMVILLLGIYGCKKDDDKEQGEQPDYTERDEQIIQDYFVDNNITDTIADPSGMYIKHLEIGDGEQVTGDIDQIKVLYTGYYLPTEVVFDNAQSPGVWMALDGLIEGWQIGIPYMKKGGKATLYIPSRYAYKSNVLKFNITLLDFTTK
ncbi:hypothetical protein E9993_14455 [Labilibacter sediminis]|nr:hypothetical protein E9993_14455 [Labilibacter sediminis]